MKQQFYIQIGQQANCSIEIVVGERDLEFWCEGIVECAHYNDDLYHCHASLQLLGIRIVFHITSISAQHGGWLGPPL